MWQTEAESPYQTIFREKGDDVQKLSVIETLPQLLAEDAHSCITRVLPKIQQSLPTASAEFHMAASVIFKQVLEQRLVSHSTFTEVFLQSILSSLDSREPAISHAWLETMLDVIELLPVEIIRREILPIAIIEGQISQTVNSRITCCRLMGKIATRFDPVSVQKEILPTVQSLCQDINNDVRACICLQLRYVAQNMGTDITKLIPFVVELASDEGSNVRQAVVQTIGYLLPQLQPDTIKDVMIPLIKIACENAVKTEDDVVGVIAQEFGKLAQSSESYLSPAEKTWFIKYFVQLAQMGTIVTSVEESKREFSFTMGNNIQMNDKTIECRRNCAFNVPAMFLFASSVLEGVSMLIPTFRNLANDSNHMVRRTIACSLHEIIKVLGSKSGLIKVELIKLLKDNHEEVLQSLVPHISEILDRLLQNQLIGVDNAESSTIDLGRSLIRCEHKISSTHNWRLSVLMLNQFENLPKYFPSEFIYTYLVPIVSNRILYSRPLPVRLAAGRTLLVFLRYNLNFQQRIEIRNQFCTTIAHSPNSYMRMLFIRIMIEGLSIFSSVYFKEHFCSTLLSLMDDPIANIRFKIITLIPTIKACLRLPADKKLLSTLETNMRNLMSNEKDRDVSAALVDVASQIETIEVRIDSQPSPTKLSRYDSEDMKKYEEEKKLDGMLSKTSAHTGKKRSIVKPTTNRTSSIATSSPGRSSNKGTSQGNNEYSRSSVLPKPPLIRQNAVASRLIPDQSKTSSMPKIPVTLVDDEFMVDAGIRIPSQLASSQSSSRIPNLQDIIYGNKKVSNTNRMRRCDSAFDKTKPMNFGLPRRFSVDYEDTGNTLLMPPPSSSTNLSSNHCEFQYSQPRIDDHSSQSGVAFQNRTRFGFELNERKLMDDQAKRISDKDGVKPLQSKNIIDKNKRHSTSYNMKLLETKESKPKFKRHSMEVTDYNAADRSNAGRTMRRFSTLDVNHNQGLSKIPIRNVHTSGSRTAPVTRTSSPIRVDSELFEKAGYNNPSTFSYDGRLRRFRSSDEEVEKLCQKC